MQRVNEFAFYELAVQIHGLTEVQDGAKYSEIWYPWTKSRDALEEIYRQRPLSFTTPAAKKLKNAISEIVPESFQEAIAKIPKEGEEDPELPSWQVYQVRSAAAEFETVLQTECQLMDTYFVSKKGAYSTKDLVENAHHQIPLPGRNAVPQITRDDFDQAGKCIAFDVYTAAAFHLLRGTEAVVREYYELAVPGPKKANPKMRNWGTYIRLLRNHGGNPSIISITDHLRDAYRNPVLHPSDFYDEERVFALFGLCVSAIILLQAEIAGLKLKSAPLLLPAIGGFAKVKP